jgi:hypothetical protein
MLFAVESASALPLSPLSGSGDSDIIQVQQNSSGNYHHWEHNDDQWRHHHHYYQERSNWHRERYQDRDWDRHNDHDWNRYHHRHSGVTIEF